MPYTIRKQKCKRSDGKSGNYVLKYKPKKPTKKKKDSEGYVKAGCHTSKKKANSQRAAIEGGPRESKISEKQKLSEETLRAYVRKVLSEKKWSDLKAPKGVTIKLSPEDFDTNEPGVRDLDDEIFELIQNAYRDVEIEPGVYGNAKIRSAKDLPAGYTIMQAADIDEDPDPDYFRGSKMRSGKVKLGVVGHDGSPYAVQKYLDETAAQLLSGGMAEMSGKIAHIMITRYKVPAVTNQVDVERLLGKSVEWVGNHPDQKYASRYGPKYQGFYNRSIGGGLHMKILLGSV